MIGSAVARVLVTRSMELLLREDSEQAFALLQRHTGEHEAIMACLRRNRLSGYFHTLIRDTALTGLFSADELAEMAGDYAAQARRNNDSITLMADLKHRLERADIPFLTLKGLFIAQRFFGGIDRRFMWDIDLLVRPRDLYRALDELRAAGLTCRNRGGVDIRRSVWGIHALELKGDHGKVDLHAALRNLPGVHFDIEAMWRRSGRFECRGLSLPTLSVEDTLLFCALGLGTDLQKGSHNLKKLWDIHMILRRVDSELDWPGFLQQRRAEGSAALVMNVLAMTAYLCGGDDGYPRLNSLLRECDDLLLIRNATEAETVFDRPRGDRRNRAFYFRLLPGSAAMNRLQWLLTVPARRWFYGRPARPPAR